MQVAKVNISGNFTSVEEAQKKLAKLIRFANFHNFSIENFITFSSPSVTMKDLNQETESHHDNDDAIKPNDTAQ